MRELIIGIDDAGRGPVLGPMILAGVLIQKEDEQTIKDWGAKDSKLLTPEKRAQIADKILNTFQTHIEITQPHEIDEHKNLNWLEAEKAAMIINNLLEVAEKEFDFNNSPENSRHEMEKVLPKATERESLKSNFEENLNNLAQDTYSSAKGGLGGHLKEPQKQNKITIIVDCPSVNIESWTEYVQKLITKKDQVTLSCEHKADFNHPIVSAASIIAKEKRENQLKILKQELGIDFGSGYPSDPTTKEFLKNNYSNPKYEKLIRKSWETYKRIVKEKAQRALF